MDELSKNLKTTDKLLGKGTINIGTIHGGTATNVVPDYCEVEIDRRIVPGENIAIVLSQIKKILDGLKLDYELEVKKSRAPFKLSENSYIVKFLRGIVSGDYGGAPGYTEAELYKTMANIDCVVFGPGEKEVIHKPNEYVYVADLIKSKDYFSRIVRMWCHSPK